MRKSDPDAPSDGDNDILLEVPSLSELPVSLSHSEVVQEQSNDPSLKELFERVLPSSEISSARIRALFERLAEARLTVNLAKCDFAMATVTYLGRVVGQGHVAPVQAKVTVVAKYPQPTTKKELQKFLGCRVAEDGWAKLQSEYPGGGCI
ncbi:hypothetical protein JOB18_010825 [Solea senegalensis]|uniref:Uncharacterized protein n=1 Tax=Solea senegalensis TaxID=28829 RepID=A0AAV6R9R8_SOLSE|nr:hypothetical protein JOB18_010825 [Solea senegalensis]